MFDLFRSREKSVRVLLGVLLGLVALSMLFYLIPGGPGMGGGANQNVIASIGNEKITTIDVERAVQNMTQGQQNLPRQILAMYVPSIVNQLIEAKAMAYKAREMGLTVSDEELGDAIYAQVGPAMGGKFDQKIYEAMLSQAGTTVADFENQEREELLRARLQNMEAQSLIVTDEEAKAEYARKNLKVGLSYVEFQGKDFESKVSKDPAALKAYFDKNRAQFRVPEKRDFDLITGTTADFVQNAKVSDADLQREYQENIDSYRVPERVLVRHILIKTQGLPKDQAPKLKAKAEDILKQLQHGGDFAKLATENSDDPGSKVKGGELGWIVRGQTVPNFEKAAFSLAPGQLSNIVETEYGYHILQVEKKENAHVQSFDDVKPQLMAEARTQAGNEDLRKAMEAAHSELQRNPTQAEAIAKKYNLKFTKLTNLSNTDTIPDLNLPVVKGTIFGTPKGGVTDVIDLSQQGKFAIGVVTNVKPSRNAEFADVQNDVTQRYVTAESLRLSQDAAKKAAERAKKGESLEAIAKDYGLEVKTAAPFTVDGAAEGIGSASEVGAAFKDNVGDVVGPVSAQADEFVCKVTQKIPADMTQFAQNKDAMIQTLSQQRQQAQAPLFRESVVDELKKRHKIKINDAVLERVIGSFKS